MSVFIAVLFVVYGLIFRFIVGEERSLRRIRKIPYQDTDLSMGEDSQSPSPDVFKSDISPSPSPVRPKTILKKKTDTSF